MRSIEAEGRSVEEAVQRGLTETGWPRAGVAIEVLEDSSGVLGWLGGRRRVRIRISRRQSKLEVAAAFLREIIAVMGLGPTAVEAGETPDYLLLSARGPGLGLLIGRRGATLEELQRVVNAVAAGADDDSRRVLIDLEGYREKRAATLERLAIKLAERVRRTGCRVTLEPMSAPERRVIHLALRDHPHVVTRSEGDEPRRRVVISVASRDDGPRP